MSNEVAIYDLIKTIQENNEQLAKIVEENRKQNETLLLLSKALANANDRVDNLNKQIDLLGQRIQRYH